MKYGERLHKARKTIAGLTQAELAGRIDHVCTQENISKLERSDASGSEFTVQFAHACGVNAIWLATGEGSPLSVEQPRARYGNEAPSVRDLLDALRYKVGRQPQVVISSVAQLIANYVEDSDQETREQAAEAIMRLLTRAEAAKPFEDRRREQIPVTEDRRQRLLPSPMTEMEHVYGSKAQPRPRKHR